MADITDLFVPPGRGYNSGGLPILNIRNGGQYGYTPNLAEVEASTVYVPRDLTVLLVRPPRMFDYMKDREIWVEGLRSLIETHAYSIEGFNYSGTLETSDYDLGAGGEVMKAVVDAKRTPTDLVFNFRELKGQPISRFLEQWIRLGIMDPDTNHPLITTLRKDELVQELPQDWLLSQYSMTILAFEPDDHFNNVQRAWIVSGAHPLSWGEVTGTRNPATAKSIREMAIPFTGIAESTEGVRLFAQQVLDNINIKGANPYQVKSHLTDADIKLMREGSNSGSYIGSVDRVKNSQVTPDAG